MPADPRRRIVNSRMMPEQIEKLDRIAVERGSQRGRPVSRSRVITELVEEEFRRKRYGDEQAQQGELAG